MQDGLQHCVLPKAPENFFLLKAALLHRLGLDTKSDSVASNKFCLKKTDSYLLYKQILFLQTDFNKQILFLQTDLTNRKSYEYISFLSIER